ncbi:hypothetical protein [Desulfosarcina cetonica]|uniref:hypothetical protein n=1 Tax=Desulfosarcina cetonica TaxID=90730 RepID=UPI0006CFF0BE|nr:hypothetical protein [Desulfosarcina cetonica]
MEIDIRDRATLNHADVTALNFIRATPPYIFRRHYRHGLRSHIMEILNPGDVAIEQSGTIMDGIRHFPMARPRRMFRIFRTRLKTLDEALGEIDRVKIVERFLGPDFMATSTECIVDYQGPAGREIVLCGFQSYVSGAILDPWTLLDSAELLGTLFDALGPATRTAALAKAAWITKVQQQGAQFIQRVKRMVEKARHIPDLAGVGNLILTAGGNIRLVDINNISPVAMDDVIPLDEKGYPSATNPSRRWPSSRKKFSAGRSRSVSRSTAISSPPGDGPPFAKKRRYSGSRGPGIDSLTPPQP